MGMYDTLRIETTMPGYTGIPKNEFQTKSLDCLMHNYVISNKGELYREQWEFEWIDDDRHMLHGYEQIIPDTYHRDYLTDFHGDIIFYEGKNIDGKWREYTARFTEGKLTRIWYEDKQY